jgi:hypothetical protein
VGLSGTRIDAFRTTLKELWKRDQSIFQCYFIRHIECLVCARHDIGFNPSPFPISAANRIDCAPVGSKHAELASQHMLVPAARHFTNDGATFEVLEVVAELLRGRKLVVTG